MLHNGGREKHTAYSATKTRFTLQFDQPRGALSRARWQCYRLHLKLHGMARGRRTHHVRLISMSLHRHEQRHRAGVLCYTGHIAGPSGEPTASGSVSVSLRRHE